MSYPKSRLGKLHIKKADLLRELDAVLTALEAELVTVLPTFAAVRLLNGSVATLEVTGKSTFHDGFQGIFDRQSVGTSILLQALDIRVKRSYSHFGPQPLYMRSAGNIGDIENFDGNIYGLCGYLDWSTMAAHRRRHIQIYGTGDSVFGPANFPTSNYGPRMKALTWRQAIDDFATELKTVAASESGSFDVWYDTNATTHQVTWQTLAAIIGDM